MPSFDFNKNSNDGDVFIGGARTIVDEGLRAHMLRVYNYMGLGLGISGLLAYLVASSEQLTQAIFGTPLAWLVMLAPLGFVFFMSFSFHRMSAQALKTTFFVFCAVMGLSLATIFLVFTEQSILRVFFITAAMFAGTSLYGYTTRKDLTGFGSFLMMGLIGIIIASLVNIFIGSTTLQFVVSVLGVLIFTGLTAWDTQRIKMTYANYHGAETNDKLAVMGALSLYLNFINLLQIMLRFMGDRR